MGADPEQIKSLSRVLAVKCLISRAGSDGRRRRNTGLQFTRGSFEA